MIRSPVAITGANGRLGQAVLNALDTRGIRTAAWMRPEYDLDDPLAAAHLVERDRPALVVHCAAWTDVDGCARDPSLARRRNAEATRELAVASVERGTDMVSISTNEVFDGRRTDGVGYTEKDPTAPINSYGVSKLEGERLAAEVFAGSDPHAKLWIVRTAWLFGPPGNDFPTKILAAADRLEPGAALPVVADETGSPTYTVELAAALVGLISTAPEGTYHLAAAGRATRFDVAQQVIGRCRPGASLRPIGSDDFQRASEAPRWSVLDSSRAAGLGIRLRPWADGLNAYLQEVCTPPI